MKAEVRVTAPNPFAQWQQPASEQQQTAPQTQQGPTNQGWGQQASAAQPAPVQQQAPQGWGQAPAAAPAPAPVQQQPAAAPAGWLSQQPSAPPAPVQQQAPQGFGTVSNGAQAPNGMAFGLPMPSGDYPLQNNLVGWLLLIFPKSIDEQRRNQQGQIAPQMTADIVVLGHAEQGPIVFPFGGNPAQGRPNPSSVPSPHRFEDVWISGKGVLNKTKAYMPGGEMYAQGLRCALGVMRLGNPKQGQSAPYFLDTPTESHIAFATQWMQSQAAAMVGRQ